MATSDEAKAAIIEAIVQLAPEQQSGEDIKALAEAWEIVRDVKPRKAQVY